jgi:hypothetical protein
MCTDYGRVLAIAIASKHNAYCSSHSPAIEWQSHFKMTRERINPWTNLGHVYSNDLDVMIVHWALLKEEGSNHDCLLNCYELLANDMALFLDERSYTVGFYKWSKKSLDQYKLMKGANTRRPTKKFWKKLQPSLFILDLLSNVCWMFYLDKKTMWRDLPTSHEYSSSSTIELPVSQGWALLHPDNSLLPERKAAKQDHGNWLTTIINSEGLCWKWDADLSRCKLVTGCHSRDLVYRWNMEWNPCFATQKFR